jgi:hypothetical protein
MTDKWGYIEIVCSHGRGVKPKLVGAFRHNGDSWEKTNKSPHELRILRNDELYRWEFTNPGTPPVPLRQLHVLQCERCSRKAERQDERLQEDLYWLSQLQVQAIEVDVFNHLNEKVLILATRLQLLPHDLTLARVRELHELPCDSLYEPDAD